jgi:hydroxymethylpyrimidine/phosphomethylpyrimidine kinase
VKRALTIAGSDSGGGAGIQADLKTFLALGVHGASAITAVTAQNTLGIVRVDPVPAKGIEAQIDAVLSDIGADAIKLGMLGGRAAVLAVARALERWSGIPIVVDPVMVAKSGDRLLDQAALDAFRRRIVPLADLLTPNLPEVEALVGRAEAGEEEGSVRRSADALLRLGAKAVLVKGGHGRGRTVRDWLVEPNRLELFEHPRRRTRSTHGTGCTLASAIAAQIARGDRLRDAVENALAYVDGAIANATGLGAGAGPVHHGWRIGTTPDPP